ncbi:App1 family protein [soil metagenome]
MYHHQAFNMANIKINNPLSPALIIKKKLGFLQQPWVVLYRGFGNRHTVHVKGRILEEKALAITQSKHSKLRNFKEMAQRYFSGYFPNMAVNVRCAGQQQQVLTQHDGLFEAIFHFEQPLAEGWLPTEASMTEAPQTQPAHGEVLIADGGEGLGVISDVDDTVLISHSTEALKALRLLLFRNAKSRMPFEGVGALYQALCRGVDNRLVPIFYVSSSEWNLYDLLESFFAHNHIPKGPFLLHDYRTNLLQIRARGHERHNHKLEKITRLLKTYPGRQFVLIGDSGQRDAEIYCEVVEQFPNRIKAVFIRNVSHNLRSTAINEIYERLNRADAPMYLVDDSLQAAKEALQLGLIQADELAAVAEGMRKDLKAPTTLLEGILKTE